MNGVPGVCSIVRLFGKMWDFVMKGRGRWGE